MKLTHREIEVMSLLCAGKKDKQIAEVLGVSVRTVQNHLARIYIKSNVKNRTQAIIAFFNYHKKLMTECI